MEFITSSVRGFAITGNKSYFDIYRAEEAALKQHLADLGDFDGGQSRATAPGFYS